MDFKRHCAFHDEHGKKQCRFQVPAMDSKQ